MQIVFLIRPYAINMYSFENDIYNLLGTQKFSHIENESNADYENRVVFVCKDICQDFLQTDIFKNNRKNIENVKVVLTNPWSVYEVINLEKDLEKEQVINKDIIDKLIVHKVNDSLSVIKNDIYNISLNGYSVNELNGQRVRFLHLQYLSIFSSANFLNKLKNTLETIFHLHEIQIDSIYSYINNIKKTNNELRIMIEDQSIDLMYVCDNRVISTLFIPCGCVSVKNDLKKNLHIDDSMMDKILKSKSINLNQCDLSMTYDKSMDNIWRDLSVEVREKIDTQINLNLEFIKIQIRNFIDSMDIDNIVKGVKINIYTLDDLSHDTVGLILSDNLKKDSYTMSKLLTDESNRFTKKIF